MSEEVKSAVLSVIDKFCDDSGKILIEDVYRILKKEYGIDRVSAGKAIVKLYEEGKVAPSEYYYVRRA
ncbi:hypothetical protein DRO47_00785 [Candidatus Bathyarchaeota archaeon]|nr:MAG: hypothetical protein CW709_03375 [Candidatus Bathyarchaeota archaeon]RLI23363.1 MAG: hypothetical protein DRO47_00785 [Candidatus Bathyarchaeota archaeon]